VFNENLGCQVIPLNKGDGFSLTASCCLVIDQDHITLVDPGSLGSIVEINKAIEACGYSFEHINQVFYTHLHFDHYAHIDWPAHVKSVFLPKDEVIFVNKLMAYKDDVVRYEQYLIDTHNVIAPIFVRQFIRLRKDHRYSAECLNASGRIVHYEDNAVISRQVKTVYLGGHCHGMHGLSVQTSKGQYLIASDAVLDKNDWLENDISKHFIVSDADEWWLSREKIALYDWVLPGHGDAFNPKEKFSRGSCYA
jgi:glyoxylase-like metal-dependent hydrolase (beta-lactamase superfamily II)